MTVLQALLLGLVEGITEYLPVSSTGHLILASWLLGLGSSRETWDHAFTFNIVIQAGAIAAVLGLYRARCAQMLAGLVGRDPAGLRLGLQLLVAFLPAAACGLLFKDMIRAHLNGPWPVVAALFGGGLLMLWVARRGPGKGRGLGDLSFRDALLIGACQTLALWPGTSRSMMAILPGLLLGMAASAAAEFSFLLGLLTLGAATAYEAMKEGGGMLREFGTGPVLAGFAAATISAALAVRWLVAYLNRHGVAAFGWYRVAVAALFAGLLLSGWLSIP